MKFTKIYFSQTEVKFLPIKYVEWDALWGSKYLNVENV